MIDFTYKQATQVKKAQAKQSIFKVEKTSSD